MRARPQVARSDLERMGLVNPGDTVRMSPPSGGVASDIFKVEAGGHALATEQRLDDANLHYRNAILVRLGFRGHGKSVPPRAELIDVLTKAGRAPDVRAELLALVADPPAASAL